MRAFLLAVVLTLLCTTAAQAASVAYIDNGEVWLSSLDGVTKTRLAAPVINAEGVEEKWLDVTQADNGRIVAVRNKPGRLSSFNWFKVWEPNGTSTIEGPLNMAGHAQLPVYPLGFDLSSDGSTMVYGYSNSNCCPYTLARGMYVKTINSGALEPIALSGWEYPTLVGGRVIARSGTDSFVQKAAATTFGDDFAGWIRFGTPSVDLRRTDVAANGALAAAELEHWDNGTQTVGKIEVVSIPGIDAPPVFPSAIDCYLPAAGVARETSLSQDASRIAWTDEGGLKVAGGPTGANESVCSLAVAPVTISATGRYPSIGGADVSAFLPPPPPVVVPPPPPAPPAQLPAPPEAGLASSVKLKATGLSIPVTVSGPGKVTLTATVPAKAMGKKGKPVTIGTGSANATRAGKVTVKLKLTAAAKKRLKKLKGTKVTLTFTQNGRSTIKTVRLK